jgi:hypothetical protein
MTLIDNVKQRANAQIDSQKSKATDTLGVIANAVRGTTGQLRNEQHDMLAQYIEGAANQLDRMSAALRNKDLTTLVDDARRLARRQPALFIGGSLAVGLLAARFLKSSARHNRDEYGDDGSYRRTDYPRASGGVSSGEPRYSQPAGGPGAYGTTATSGTTTPGTTTGQR